MNFEFKSTFRYFKNSFDELRKHALPIVFCFNVCLGITGIVLYLNNHLIPASIEARPGLEWSIIRDIGLPLYTATTLYAFCGTLISHILFNSRFPFMLRVRQQVQSLFIACVLYTRPGLQSERAVQKTETSLAVTRQPGHNII